MMVTLRSAKEAFDVVNENLLLVLLVGLGSTAVGSDGLWMYLSLGGFGLAIVITIIVYGRIVAQLASGRRPRSFAILKTNWFNYLAVIALLAVPVWAIRRVGQLLMPDSLDYVLPYEGFRAALAVATIYVVPIVFIKQANVVAIVAGIAFFFRRLKASVWIVVIVVLAYTIGAVRYAVLVLLPFPWAILAVVGVGVVLSYMLFVSFAAASGVLLKNPQSATGATGDQSGR